jgi:Tfp pilus assembly protein PilF
MDSPTLTALRRLQKADQERQAAKERLLLAWEQLAQKDEAAAEEVWDEVESVYLSGEMAAILALLARMEHSPT